MRSVQVIGLFASGAVFGAALVTIIRALRASQKQLYVRNGLTTSMGPVDDAAWGGEMSCEGLQSVDRFHVSELPCCLQVSIQAE